MTPGLPGECPRNLREVLWSVENPGIASVSLSQLNAVNDTAGSVSRAWVTGITVGSTQVHARVVFIDGVREAQPAGLRVVRPEAPAERSIPVVEGTTEITFNEFTGLGGSELIPVTLPAAGRVDINVDWTSFRNEVGFFFRQGDRVVVEAQVRPLKPRRESAEGLAAGNYKLDIFAIGSGRETATYEVRFTPK